MSDILWKRRVGRDRKSDHEGVRTLSAHGREHMLCMPPMLALLPLPSNEVWLAFFPKRCDPFDSIL
jgi:hypothetical protein